MAEPRIIKKYPNRRLYDTGDSRYITLADVRKLVLGDEPFKVIDTQSEQDITRTILMQIIIEQESGGEPLFTTDMLSSLIRFYDDAVHDVFSSYLDQSMRLFVEQQQTLQQQMQEALGGNPLQAVTDLTRRNVELWSEMQQSFLKAAGVSVSDSEKRPGTADSD